MLTKSIWDLELYLSLLAIKSGSNSLLPITSASQRNTFFYIADSPFCGEKKILSS